MLDALSSKLDALLTATQENQAAKDAKIADLTQRLALAEAQAVDPETEAALEAKVDAVAAALTPIS